MTNTPLLGALIGKDEHGIVRKGMAARLRARGQPRPTQVAVKTVRNPTDPEQNRQIIKELQVLTQAGRHLNITNLLGAVFKLRADNEADHANHQQQITYHETSAAIQDADVDPDVLSTRELISFAFQISRGMAYLSSRLIIHRDLAARTILVCHDGVVKIADFGMARRLSEYVLLDER
ncbi:platelet-derived growth factor receptor alpha-like, partial [Paramacrobiotus metropolitanus]|uniref:platelet-derived growth factor receptor alpha-like n=1 Tax=Paramacrobiotus metropolitanus TaxID=2943436 RepID=UPI002445E58B